MQTKYFGTDGIRGKSNVDVITPEVMIKLARAASVEYNLIGTKHTVVIGKDTRLSGYMLEFALTAGFISMGVNIVLAGPLPTPAISMLVKSMRASLGIMISASHNPYYDNGIKMFDSSGYKICSWSESRIEKLMDIDLSKYLASHDALGKVFKLNDERGRYIEHVKYSFPQEHTLDGIKIVVDCANGAAYSIAPKVLQELGAQVISCGVSPDGFNINHDCGAIYTKNLAKTVLEFKADIGIALDGDADRVVIIDEKGNVIDGDQIIAALACYLLNKKKLDNKIVVTTIMSNIGLEKYLEGIGIRLVRTPVGDKYISIKMREIGCSLGGEQSGHIIIGSKEATGDGIKAALQVLAIYKSSKNVPISKLLNKFIAVPQLTKNIKFNYKYFGQDLINIETINNLYQSYQTKYSIDTRIVLRQSGTEPLVRIMVESTNLKQAENILNKIYKDLLRELSNYLT